jgi:hypothetical protein
MRILRLTLAGVLALSTPIVAHAHSPGSNHNAANTTPIIDQRGNSSSVSQPAPGFGGWHAAHDRVREWCPPHWGPNHIYGGWGPYGGRAVPTYWVYVPGSAVFDDPFPDWRGPTGGWGNP